MLTQMFQNSAVPPALLLAGLNAYNLWNEHWEHWSHMPPLEDRVEYPYQNIRTRNFPWGDGDKVSKTKRCGAEPGEFCSVSPKLTSSTDHLVRIVNPHLPGHVSESVDKRT